MMKSLGVMLLCLGCFRPAVAQDLQVAVPLAAGSPHIDGRVHADEWSGASVTVLPDSSEVLLVRDPRHLYVAFRLPRRGLGSLCVRNGEKVRILHASAALGTAVYLRDGNAWRLVEPFRFTMRETDDSDNARRKRADFLADHGWVASTVHMGGTEPALEYKIRIDLLDPETPTLGVVAMPLVADPILARLPAGMDGGCSGLDLVRGYAPERERFDPPGWVRLDMRD